MDLDIEPITGKQSSRLRGRQLMIWGGNQENNISKTLLWEKKMERLLWGKKFFSGFSSALPQIFNGRPLSCDQPYAQYKMVNIKLDLLIAITDFRDRITISQCFLFQLDLGRIAWTPTSPTSILIEKTKRHKATLIFLEHLFIYYRYMFSDSTLSVRFWRPFWWK